MSNNIDILLVGAGYMGTEYYKVLSALGCNVIVVGNGEESAKKFEETTGATVISGGIEHAKGKMHKVPQKAIIATPVETLANICIATIELGVKDILIEKPAGICYSEVKQICDTCQKCKANVYVAYNRRFYASTEKALDIIRQDNGIRDIHFEFTEWGNRIGEFVKDKSERHREAVFVTNSSHVVDLVFFLAGLPKEISCYTRADSQLKWHKTGCVYTGAGITERGILFSYQADWNAPGRWAIEIMTHQHRLYFKPMEKLQIQNLNSVTVEEVELDDELDLTYKPGLYKQVMSFINEINDGKKLTIQEQLHHMEIYAKMENKPIV